MLMLKPAAVSNVKETNAARRKTRATLLLRERVVGMVSNCLVIVGVAKPLAGTEIVVHKLPATATTAVITFVESGVRAM